MKKIFILVAIIMYCFMAVGFCADGFYVIPVKGKCSYAIGDTGPAGGVVFYIKPDSGGKHGMEAAPADQSSGVQWGCAGTALIGPNGEQVGTGAVNSILIATQCGSGSIAAKLAEIYVLYGVSGWFLPSKEALYLLSIRKDVVGGFSTDAYYWSSTQDVTSPGSENNAWAQWIATIPRYHGDVKQKVNMYRVRAVREF